MRGLLYIIAVILAGIVLMFIDKFDLTSLIAYIGAILVGTLIFGALSLGGKKEQKPKTKKQEIEFL